MRAPDPATPARRAVAPRDDFAIPPPPLVCAATAFRRDLRRPRPRFPVVEALTLAAFVALLGAWVWNHHAAPPPEPAAIAGRVAR